MGSLQGEGRLTAGLGISLNPLSSRTRTYSTRVLEGRVEQIRAGSQLRAW